MSVSVVIPAYNEAKRIGKTLQALRTYLDGHEPGSEIIVVDDGSTDSTSEVADAFGPPVHVLRSKENRGKGHAIRIGLGAAAGDLVALSDCDLPYGLEGIAACFDAIRRTGADAAVGDRTMAASSAVARPPLVRRFLSAGLSLAVKDFCGGIADTQCGVKALRGSISKSLAGALTVDGFAIDIELLRALHDRRLRVERVAVRLQPSETTSVRLLHHTADMALDLVHVAWRSRQGAYR